jgi:hypothetical protein
VPTTKPVGLRHHLVEVLLLVDEWGPAGRAPS